MKFLIDHTNRSSNNSFVIDVSNHSLNTLKLNSLFIDNMKQLKSFLFYIQENNNRLDGILIECNYDKNVSIILSNLRNQINKKCENKYQIECNEAGFLSISCNEKFNLIFSPLDYHEVFPCLGFTKPIYKFKRSYEAELTLPDYLDFNTRFCYMNVYYNNINFIFQKRLEIKNKQLTTFGKNLFSYYSINKFINNLQINFFYDKNQKIPFTNKINLLAEFQLTNNKNQT